MRSGRLQEGRQYPRRVASISSVLGLSSLSPERRDWLRRGVATLILLGAVVAFVSEERAAGGDADVQRLGVLDGVTSPGVGQAAPNFVLEEHGTGRLVRLSDYRGRTVVLNFWATWCPPCVAEMPELQSLQAKHEASGDLVVIAVDVEEPPAAVEEFKQQLALTMTILGDRTGDVRRYYGLPGLPGTFFIDRDGVIRAKALGPIMGKPLADGLASVGGG
ncbi:MAG: TlpA family protein disulfide reductase [Dehalococcoidia bacterium]|nr:MAG: TlpA family protein disulfide reductase [Dehalococcoidia bacterium]